MSYPEALAITDLNLIRKLLLADNSLLPLVKTFARVIALRHTEVTSPSHLLSL